MRRNKWNHGKVAREHDLSRVGLANKIIGWHFDECEIGAAASLLAAQPDFQAKGDNC